MCDSRCGRERTQVALLAEGVDRNYLEFFDNTVIPRVALLAEGVDRNTWQGMHQVGLSVALLAEGVDRNLICQH